MATDGDSKANKLGTNGGGGGGPSSPSSSTASETDSTLAKDTSKSLSLQAEADEATSTSLSMESITDGKNTRGIPAAKFIEDIDGFASAFSPRKTHENECKRREKELKADADAATKADSSSDSDLFATPPPRDDCPICMLPLPLVDGESAYQPCCGKMLCGGCIKENYRVTVAENNRRIANDDPRPLLEICCPFCREPRPKSGKECMDRLRKRMGLGDARAFHNIACGYYTGDNILPKDERKAFDHYLRAAELGSIEACYVLATHYYEEGKVVKKDMTKCRCYLEVAAKGGDVDARRNLGVLEAEEENDILAAMRHFHIAALAGDDESLKCISLGYRNGLVSKDVYASALRAHQKARDEAKSDERDRFAAYLKRELH